MTVEERAATPAPPTGRLPQDAWGILFCGGESRRMGRDKARLVVHGAELIRRPLRALAALTPRVLLASGSAPRYPELGLECVLDRGADQGPIAGLEAALERLRAEGVRYACVLACDMPAASATALERLLDRARSTRAHVCLAITAGGLEPLCAVYDVACLPALRAARARGERRLDSFHAGLRVVHVPEAELGAGCTRNLNTPADFAALTGGAA